MRRLLARFANVLFPNPRYPSAEAAQLDAARAVTGRAKW